MKAVRTTAKASGSAPGRSAPARAVVGISGWRYAPWRSMFYPRGLPQSQEFAYAARQFGGIELNGSFYSLQRPADYAAWHAATPAGFIFAVKGPRLLTHRLRLRRLDWAIANFFASGVFKLRDKLGPFLWQLPPAMAFDAERLDAFFTLLPRDGESAMRFARRRDARMRGRASLVLDPAQPLRHALEVRHESFADADCVRLLRRHGIALVVADSAGQWPCLEDLTADFVYLRLHGDTQLYTSGYGDAALQRWAARIETWRRGGEAADAQRVDGPALRRRARDVYCFFDNDAKVHAPFDAQSLMRKLGLRSGEAARAREPAA